MIVDAICDLFGWNKPKAKEPIAPKPTPTHFVTAGGEAIAFDATTVAQAQRAAEQESDDVQSECVPVQRCSISESHTVDGVSVTTTIAGLTFEQVPQAFEMMHARSDQKPEGNDL